MDMLGVSDRQAAAGSWAMSYARRAAASLAAFVTALVVGVVVPDVARADPATPVTYPAASSATRAQGRFFDTCTAPSLAALAAWR